MRGFRFLAACVAVLLASALHAQQQRQWLNVWQKDGTSVSFRLQDKPRAQFVGTKVSVSGSQQTVEWKVSEVARFELSEKPSGIDQLYMHGGQDGSAQLLSDGILVSGTKPGTQVAVYGIDGKLLVLQQTDATGSLMLSSQAWQQQKALVLKIGSTTYKMMTR
jgi:hypothetical protein